jgi:PPOX class probable F420-dependent enzyme
MTGFEVFHGERYLSLETYRKNGTAVRTPVWFAGSTAALYVYATADSGKAKRIRRDGKARIAPCDLRGNITGPWLDAAARLVTGEDYALGMRLLDRKYFPWKQLLGLARLFRPKPRVVIALRPSTLAGDVSAR